MKNAIVVNWKWLFWFVKGDTRAFVIYPFIFIKKSEDMKNRTLLQHEYFHIIQQRELWFFGFFFLYFYYYFRNLIKTRNHFKAYLTIPFETEAFLSEEKGNFKDRSHHWKKYREFEIADEAITKYFSQKRDQRLKELYEKYFKKRWRIKSFDKYETDWTEIFLDIDL